MEPVIENDGRNTEPLHGEPGRLVTVGADHHRHARKPASQQEGLVAGILRIVGTILGNDTFCIAALQGLEAAAYEGEIVAVSQCITDATRQAIPGEDLAGISIISGSAMGAADDPTYQLYEAVMGAYGDDVTDPESNIPMGAYTVMGALATALEGM